MANFIANEDRNHRRASSPATVLISRRVHGEGRDICNSTASLAELGNVISVFGVASNGHLPALLPSLHLKLFIEMDWRYAINTSTYPDLLANYSSTSSVDWNRDSLKVPSTGTLD